MNATRVSIIGLLTAALVVVGVVLLDGNTSYTLHADFVDAGRLVTGTKVTIAGRKVGHVTGVHLADNGNAVVDLSIDNHDDRPLPAHTRALIRAVGQAGIDNRFVELEPGPLRGARLPSGASLPTAQTTSIISLDAILDSFGPRQRADLRGLIRRSAAVYSGSTAHDYNRMLASLAPGLARLDGVTGDLASDASNLDELIGTATSTAATIASRHTELRDAVTSTAQLLDSVAAQRTQLAQLLEFAPNALRRTTTTLVHTRRAVDALRPALHELPATTRPLGTFLRRTGKVLPHTVGPLRTVGDLLPDLRRTFNGLRPLAVPVSRALNTTGLAFQQLRPILTGVRYYATDLILGVLNGIAGIATAEYDADGHYAKIEFVQEPETLISGSLAPLMAKLLPHGVVPGILASRTHLLRRCPAATCRRLRMAAHRSGCPSPCAAPSTTCRRA